MFLYNLLYVQHATVAQFESVSVEDFPQFMASREALINKPWKLSSYFALDIFVANTLLYVNEEEWNFTPCKDIF